MSLVSHAYAVAFSAMVVGAAVDSLAASNAFYDLEKFENSFIDRTVWWVTGDGISVGGGAVTFARHDPADAFT